MAVQRLPTVGAFSASLELTLDGLFPHTRITSIYRCQNLIFFVELKVVALSTVLRLLASILREQTENIVSRALLLCQFTQ